MRVTAFDSFLRHIIYHRHVDCAPTAGKPKMVGQQISSLLKPTDTASHPYRLMLKKRNDEARRVLERLHPGDPHAVDKDRREIDAALQMSANRSSFKSMFAMGPQRILHRVILASVVQIMLQFTGVNAIAFYTPTIYENSLRFPAVEASALAAASQVRSLESCSARSGNTC